MAIGYSPTVYENGKAPALSAANLNKAENGIKAVSDWADTLLAATGVPDATKVPKALGADLVALITAAGYTLSPAEGTASLDGIADGTTYARVLSAIAAALNGGTYDAASVSAAGIGTIVMALSAIDADNLTAIKALKTGFYRVVNGSNWPDIQWGALNIEQLETSTGAEYTKITYSPYSGIDTGKKYTRFIRAGALTSWVTEWNSYSDGNGGQPPAPKPNTGATIGKVSVAVYSAPNTYLPAGGKWMYFVMDATAQIVAGPNVATGGTEIVSGGDSSLRTFCWRVE